MKLSQAKEYLPFVQAVAEGKKIQYLCGQLWITATLADQSEFFTGEESPGRYRIKPEPKLRPWNPEEVPVGALVRSINHVTEVQQLIICRGNYGLTLGSSGVGFEIETLQSALVRYEHSLDNGKTWLPCGVEENT